MKRIKQVLAAALLVPSFPVLAQAQEISGFQTPSGNIHCSLYEDQALGATVLDCGLTELGNTTPPLPMPADCDADWGYRFAVKTKGKSFMVCAGDTLADPKHPVLQYGETYNDANIGCYSTAEGLECTNEDGHGFFMSKTRQRLF